MRTLHGLGKDGYRKNKGALIHKLQYEFKKHCLPLCKHQEIEETKQNKISNLKD